MDRRSFLRVSGAAGVAAAWSGSLTACAQAAGTSAAPAAARAANAFTLARVGVQLYTVRDAMGKDLDGTLAQIAAAGYRLVETAGLYGRTAADLRALFDKHGIRTSSGHYPLGDAEGKTDETFATAKALGQEFVVIPWLDPSQRTAETFGSLPGRLNKLGEQARAAGLKVAYHNHDFEFETYGASTTVLERLLANTDPALVSFELDAYWAFKAGREPAEIVARYPGRFTMLHLKDSTAAPEKAFADVGKGVIDFRRLLAAAQRNGLRYAFVERDVSPDPIASIRASHEYLRTVLSA
ncbi:MAG TPA: sugar phosphate isomerase/epimerase [Gemmatimonadaceae bacterium]|nr:sugar phosphate isomerase/epimerase [Gemmatimonadaceae bacterium]